MLETKHKTQVMPHFSILTRCIKALLLLLLLLQLSASDTYSRLSQPSDWSVILNQVRDIGKDKHRRHRSYDKIGRSMRECMLTLNKSAFSPAMLGVTEPVALRSRACVRATTWGHIKGELFQNDQAATSGSLLFVIAAFVRNDDNARILGLSLGSVQAFHPTAEILVVDNGSPAKGLLVNAVDECKRNWSGAVNIVTARSNRALDKNESDASNARNRRPPRSNIIHRTEMPHEGHNASSLCCILVAFHWSPYAFTYGRARCSGEERNVPLVCVGRALVSVRTYGRSICGVKIWSR
jgi:hypothetical protein